MQRLDYHVSRPPSYGHSPPSRWLILAYDILWPARSNSWHCRRYRCYHRRAPSRLGPVTSVRYSNALGVASTLRHDLPTADRQYQG